MQKWLKRSPKILLALTVTVYGTYLIKTAMGINVSNHYSAPWVFKAPLKPLWSHQAALCEEFQTLCTLRDRVKNKVQHRLEAAKHSG
ncbi:MAG: hypothetical protein HC852_15000 [Acaryochloridaceae cyanobacterium RU_4_10]|jgi:hypothetical protein|nr:hypothetical protein [Acaryochloridaceae cyanobacterium RU_4_10]